MLLKNTNDRYGIIAIILHWGMALLIIGMLALGLYMVRLHFSLEKLRLYGWHKETGILILMLVIVRLSWRFSAVVPTLPPTLANWQKLAAHSMHLLLYCLMLAMPLTGWLMTSASGLPVSFFGLFIMPDLIGPNEQARSFLLLAHTYLAYGLIALICGHIGAALQHHFIFKDNILRRMLPW